MKREELRKIRFITHCNIVNNEPVKDEVEGYFHTWTTVDNKVHAIVEYEDGAIGVIPYTDVEFVVDKPVTSKESATEEVFHLELDQLSEKDLVLKRLEMYLPNVKCKGFLCQERDNLSIANYIDIIRSVDSTSKFEILSGSMLHQKRVITNLAHNDEKLFILVPKHVEIIKELSHVCVTLSNPI